MLLKGTLLPKAAQGDRILHHSSRQPPKLQLGRGDHRRGQERAEVWLYRRSLAVANCLKFEVRRAIGP